MLRTVGDLNEYKYNIANIAVSVDGSSSKYIILATNIREINISHQYVDNIIPIIQVSANVEKELYKLLTSSEAKISMSLIIYKYIYNSKTQAKQLVFSKTFSVLNEYDMQPDEMKMLEFDKTDASADNITSVHTDQLVDASFYLIDKQRLIAYRTMRSHYLNNVSLTDAIALLFSERGFKTILMNKIPNDNTGDIYLPTYNLLSSLEFLNNRYGIFETDYVFYMDIVETYLLDKKNLGKAVKQNSPSSVKLYLEEYGSVESADVGSIIDNETYITNMTKPPTVLKYDTYTKFMNGTNIHVVDTNDNISKLTGELDRALWVYNPKVAKQAQFATNENKRGLSVALVNIDISMIGPNLLYTVIANSKYNNIHSIRGDYRLTASSIKFVRSDNDNFGVVAALKLT